MRLWPYGLTVVGSALTWLLVGLHLPTPHDLAEHGWSPPARVLVATALLVLAGSLALWALLRTTGDLQ